MASNCQEIMCELDLKTKQEAAAWLQSHNPNATGGAASADYGTVADCMKSREFCGGASSVSSDSGENQYAEVLKKVKQGARDTPEQTSVSYKPNKRQLECVRQVGNWSKIGADHRFNKARFNVDDVDKLIPIASPKLEAMLQNIEALDKNDKMISGKTYKHFIFSDVKFMGYGAKIISSGLIARGFNPILRLDKTRIVVDTKAGAKGKRFAVLSSTALWNKPFQHKLKKEILDVYNERPGNIQGEKCRLIVLDSGFKEGIDLFDVKYVHLFEPLMTSADMTQALGRATRLCGQKGLDFIQGQGWPLFVFKYSQSIPDSLIPLYKAPTLFDIALQLKGIDTRLFHITKSIQDVSILAAVDQPLTEEIHTSGFLPKLRIGQKTEVVTNVTRTPMTGAETRSNLVSNDEARSALEEAVSNASDDTADSVASTKEDPCAPRRAPGCSGTIVPFRASRLSPAVVIPTVVSETSTLVVSPPSTGGSWFELRKYIMKKFSTMAWDKQEVINKCIPTTGGAVTRAQAQRLAQEAAAAAKARAERVAKRNVKVEEQGKAAAVQAVRLKATAEARARANAERARIAKLATLRRKGTASARRAAAAAAKTRRATAATKTRKIKPASTKKPTRRIINLGPAPPPIPGKKYPGLNLIDYTPTQNFISSYFTVASPIKGMLLWHSVGTGKTCSAIALASRQFEPAGYTILWVTRHTLKADIWKNIFDQVCHATIAEEVKAGRLAPTQVEKRQRILYEQWIPPVSYKQFSNIILGRNPIYKDLVKRNGSADPLKKTLIIIDEAHKLYSADFKGSEKPDVAAFMKGLQNSYKVSGKDSARVLLMTATPYNESPMELMALLNLCREDSAALPTELPKFIEKYMDGDGNFTPGGLKTYMNDIAGQISYLNREADPSQFAQPIFADIVVPISTYESVSEGDSTDILELRKQVQDFLEEQQVIEKETIPFLQQELDLAAAGEEAQVAACATRFAGGKKKDLNDCVKRVRTTFKAFRKSGAAELKNAEKRRERIPKDIEKLTKKINTITKKMRTNGLSSMTQQAQLETRCKIGLEPKDD